MWRHPLARAVVFLCLAAAGYTAAGPLTGLALGLAGRDGTGALGIGIYSGVVSAAFLLATWVALRREGCTLAALGLAPSRRRFAEVALGFAVSAILFGGVALVRAAAVGASWEFRGAAGMEAAAVGLPLALALLLPEELLFRGYAFRKLVAVGGAPLALSLSAVAFGLYHVLGSGYWAIGAAFTFALPALGGVVFGLAALRTGGLALPIGLHLGGNWVQASVFGFGVTPDAQGTALWIAPLAAAQARTLAAPDLPLHLPYLLALLLTVYMLARLPRAPRIGHA